MGGRRRDIEIGVEFGILLVYIAVWIAGFNVDHGTSDIMAYWGYCRN
jgi:hypothetical protein